MKKKYSEHHTIPRSRGGKTETVFLPKLFHASWHVIFGNLYGDEIVLFIKAVNLLMKTKTYISANELEILRLETKRRCQK